MAKQQVALTRKITGISHILQRILSYLDAETLRNASRVSPYWSSIICNGRLWKRLVERNVANDRVWAKLVQDRRQSTKQQLDDRSQDEIFHDRIEADIEELDLRWRRGQFTRKHFSGPVASLSYYNNDEIVTLSEERGPEIWNLNSGSSFPVQSFTGVDLSRSELGLSHIRFDRRMIVFVSSHGKIQIWDRKDPDGSGPCSTLDWPGSIIASFEFSGNIIVIDGVEYLLAVYRVDSPRDVRLYESYCTRGYNEFFIEFANKYVLRCAWDNPTVAILDRQAYRLVENLEVLDLKRAGNLMATILGPEDPQNRWTMALWDVDRGIHLRTINMLVSLELPRFCFDSKHLVVSCCEFSTERPRRLMFNIGVIEMKNLLDMDVPEENLFSYVLNEQFENSCESLAIDEFRIKRCCYPNGDVVMLDFQNLGPLGRLR